MYFARSVSEGDFFSWFKIRQLEHAKNARHAALSLPHSSMVNNFRSKPVYFPSIIRLHVSIKENYLKTHSLHFIKT